MSQVGAADVACFSAGLVEVCNIVGASYHKRLLSGAGSKSLQMQRPDTASAAIESSQTTQDVSTPQATAQQGATAPAAGPALSPHAEVGRPACLTRAEQGA